MYSSRICILDSSGILSGSTSCLCICILLVPQVVFAFISFLVPQSVIAFISTFQDLVSSDLSVKKTRLLKPSTLLLCSLGKH